METKILETYSNGQESRESILSAILFHELDILPVPGIDHVKLLLAIAGKETSFGADNRSRYERAYDDDGLYGRQSKYLQSLLKKYGSIAACSYGPWQIMYPTAFEHGFAGHPLELWTARDSVKYVISYLNNVSRNGATTIEEYADAWNSGSFKDSNRPLDYMQAVRKIFDSLPSV